MSTVAPERIIVLGAGGHASELATYLMDMVSAGASVELVGFVDEHRAPGPWTAGCILGGFDALGDLVRADGATEYRYITAVGSNTAREHLVEEVERLGADNLRPTVLRHPSARVGQAVDIGQGTCLAPQTVVTTNVRIGRHCILNVNASVSHDCVIGDFTNLNPRVTICGDVRVGRGCYIGAGATIIDKIQIGDYAVIGAGAVVTRNIPSGVTAVGVPARVLQR